MSFAAADSAALGVPEGSATEISHAPGLFDALPAPAQADADPAEAVANAASQLDASGDDGDEADAHKA